MDLEGFAYPDLTASLDTPERLAAIPPELTIRGWVINAAARRLGLDATPRSGFRAFPLLDFVEMLGNVAELPGDPGRRLRDAGIAVGHAFRDQRVGKLVLTLAGDDLSRIIHAAPRIYRMGANFGEAEAVELGPRRYLVRLRNVWAHHPYLYGLLEGFCHIWEPNARVTYRRHALDGCDFICEW